MFLDFLSVGGFGGLPSDLERLMERLEEEGSVEEV